MACSAATMRIASLSGTISRIAASYSFRQFVSSKAAPSTDRLQGGTRLVRFTAKEPCRPTPPRFSGSYLPLSKTVGIERPANVLLRRGDQSNDLIVHFLNQVSRLLDCDSAQDSKLRVTAAK